jgi:cation:H+ antiporter
MTNTILLIILGLAMIIIGANFLVEGSSRIASRFGISDIVIGMTIVAIGTSAPEMVVSFLGAMKGSVGLSVGNILGSNICNILLIIGLSSIIYPMTVSRINVNRDMQFMLLSTVVLFIISLDAQIETLTIDDQMTGNVISRTEGLVLLLFFLVFMFYSVASAKRHESLGKGSDANGEEEKPAVKKNFLISLVMFIGGLAVLIWGGNILVDNAATLARAKGVSDTLIGATIIAIGTSLPELAASVMAACRKKVGIAIGNVIGSNIFNVFLILGGCATVTPLPLASVNHVHFIFLLLATLLFLVSARTSFKIRRIEGLLLFALYILYIIVTISLA